MQGSFLWKSHSLNRHMVLPLASFNLTSSANIENASEHASSQSRPQRKSLPIACAGYVFASKKTKPSLRCNRSFPIGPLPDRKSSIHSMCSESSMLHAAPMFDIIPQIHPTRNAANLPRGKKRGCGGNVSAACVFCREAIAAPVTAPLPEHPLSGHPSAGGYACRWFVRCTNQPEAKARASRWSERSAEAGEPTGAREHVCGSGVILTADVKGAREISAGRSPLAKQVARAVRARQNHAGGVPTNCGSGEQVGRRPRHQAEPRSEERRGSFTAISSFVSPSISCGKTIHSFPTSR